MNKYLRIAFNLLWSVKGLNEKYVAFPRYKVKHASSLNKLLKVWNNYNIEEFNTIVD